MGAHSHASGETIRAHDHSTRDELTPQELKVALVIAEGPPGELIRHFTARAEATVAAVGETALLAASS